MEWFKSTLEWWTMLPMQYGFLTFIIDGIIAITMYSLVKWLFIGRNRSVIKKYDAIPVRRVFVNQIGKIECKYKGGGEYGIDVSCDEGGLTPIHYNLILPEHIYNTMCVGQNIIIETVKGISLDDTVEVLEPLSVTKILGLVNDEGMKHLDDVCLNYGVGVERIQDVAILKEVTI